MTNKLQKILLGFAVAILAVILGLIGLTMYGKSTSTEMHSVELKSSSMPLEMVTESLSREVLGAVAPAMGSLSAEGIGSSADPVINPTANVMVYCDGSGYAELDNRRSTTGIGFEVLVGDEIIYRFVEGGEMLTVTFTAQLGTTVTAQTGEGIPFAVVPVPTCSAATAR